MERERESSPPDIIIQLSRVSIESLEVYHRLNPSETLLLQLPGNQATMKELPPQQAWGAPNFCGWWDSFVFYNLHAGET